MALSLRLIGFGLKKTGAKRSYRLRLNRPEAEKVAKNFKNAIVVASLASGVRESGPNSTICLSYQLNRGHIV